MSNTLEDLVGKTINYKGQDFKVHKVKKVSLNQVITTDRRTIVLEPTEVDAFLNQIQIVQPKKEFTPTIAPGNNASGKTSLDLYQPTAVQQQVQSSLLTMMDKVMADKENIPQAKSVCEVASTLIKLERNQIDLIRIVQPKN
ncbi:hypothetical protein [Cellulophaga lytica]|uniref:hypothetical protein n=1 Tax=Cellulophaga lytica TaxID=979 RepID=UPI003CE49585